MYTRNPPYYSGNNTDLNPANGVVYRPPGIVGHANDYEAKSRPPGVGTSWGVPPTNGMSFQGTNNYGPPLQNYTPPPPPMYSGYPSTQIVRTNSYGSSTLSTAFPNSRGNAHQGYVHPYAAGVPNDNILRNNGIVQPTNMPLGQPGVGSHSVLPPHQLPVNMGQNMGWNATQNSDWTQAVAVPEGAPPRNTWPPAMIDYEKRAFRACRNYSEYSVCAARLSALRAHVFRERTERNVDWTKLALPTDVNSTPASQPLSRASSVAPVVHVHAPQVSNTSYNSYPNRSVPASRSAVPPQSVTLNVKSTATVSASSTTKSTQDYLIHLIENLGGRRSDWVSLRVLEMSLDPHRLGAVFSEGGTSEYLRKHMSNNPNIELRVHGNQISHVRRVVPSNIDKAFGMATASNHIEEKPTSKTDKPSRMRDANFESSKTVPDAPPATYVSTNVRSAIPLSLEAVLKGSKSSVDGRRDSKDSSMRRDKFSSNLDSLDPITAAVVRDLELDRKDNKKSDHRDLKQKLSDEGSLKRPRESFSDDLGDVLMNLSSDKDKKIPRRVAKKAKLEKKNEEKQDHLQKTKKKLEDDFPDEFVTKKRDRAKRFQEDTNFARANLVGGGSSEQAAAAAVGFDLTARAWLLPSSVRGLSTKLEKPYLRLTGIPDPLVVRSLVVLKEAFDFVCKKYRTLVAAAEGEDAKSITKSSWKTPRSYELGTSAAYDYVCEQLKSIRQDLMVQNERSDFVVRVYEEHAQLALIHGDPGEFGQCMTQLRSLLDHGCHSDRAAEFAAYRLLYSLLSQRWTDVAGNIQEAYTTGESIVEHSVWKHAVCVRQAILGGHYVAFFRCMERASTYSKCLMSWMAEDIRRTALKYIVRSYKPSIRIESVSRWLGFGTDLELAKSFFRDLEVVLEEKEGLLLIDCKATDSAWSESVEE